MPVHDIFLAPQTTGRSIRRLVSSVCLAIGLSICTPAIGDQAEWDRLNKEVLNLYEKGKYDEAVFPAKQALRVAEQDPSPKHFAVATSLNNLAMLYTNQGKFAEAEPLFKRSLVVREKALGPEHLDVATSLNNLALLYTNQGKYAEAEPLYRRSLAIHEKALGPDHPNVATSLNNLASLYKKQGKYAEAERLSRRSLIIREKALGLEHPKVTDSLNNLASLYTDQGKYAEAEPLYKRSLAIREKALGPNHPDVAASLNNMASLYNDQGKYAEVELLSRRSLSIREKALGPDHPDVAATLNNLAWLFSTQGKYAEAEPLYRRSLAIREKALGPDHPDLATSLNNLASLYNKQGKYAEAEPLFRRSLAIREKALGLEHPDVATSLNNLASLFNDQGKYAETEPLYRRSLVIREKALGPDHPDVALSVSNLAELYQTQGKYAEAEPLYKRSLAIREKALGPNHLDVANSLNNLAYWYRNQGKYAEAEPLYRRSLAICEKVLGADHRHVATILNNLASLYNTQGKYAKAEPLFKRSLAIRERALGPNHPEVANSLNNLASLFNDQGKYAETEPLYRRSLVIREKALGPEHPNVATSLNNLASLHQDLGQLDKALAESRRATGIYRNRIIKAVSSADSASEASRNQNGFDLHIALLTTNPLDEPTPRLADESFQVAQLMQATGTADAVAKMSARFAKGDGELAKLVRDRQDAEARRTRAEAALVGTFGKQAKERNPALEQRLRDDIATAGKQIDTVDAELARRFPEYQELARLQPIAVDEVRALLKPGEAMFAYALAGDAVYLWVVTRDGAQFLPLAAKAGDISSALAKVRGQMEFDPAGNVPQVSVDILHALYQALLAPALPYLDGITHLLIVPDGALQSLPFGMLVASPPPAIGADADYRKVDWLARRYAMSVLPAVGSIKALRQFARSETAKEPFTGFGDPLVGEADGVSRGKRAKVDIATVFRGSKVRGASGQPLPTLEIADVEAIRKTPRLPETADELRQIGKALKAGPDSIWLQQKATETAVKGMDLSKYQTLAFATHGMMAGEVGGVGEPGLILTPPKEGTLDDDGYLAASEIAKLRLNADWTILSACNTASADGTPGAEGLSGLAKAFFYAGSRSLLVSHWPVASDATVPLTTRMLAEYKANPAQGKAEAHRKSMLALMDSTDHPEFAHPIYWAPFVVVGEGGASRR